MKKYGLICEIRKANPYRQMAKAIKTNNVADNLVKRQFEAYGPRMVLLTDITYIPYRGIFAYLSTIIDAFTKQILSYVLSESLEVDFVLETVNQMVEKHGMALTTETIIHSDQGCHYTSCSFIQLLKDKKLSIDKNIIYKGANFSMEEGERAAGTKNISVVGFNNVYLSAYRETPLASVDINAERLGYYAIKILVEYLVSGRTVKSNQIIDVKLIERESLKR